MVVQEIQNVLAGKDVEDAAETALIRWYLDIFCLEGRALTADSVGELLMLPFPRLDRVEKLADLIVKQRPDLRDAVNRQVDEMMLRVRVMTAAAVVVLLDRLPKSITRGDFDCNG